MVERAKALQLRDDNGDAELVITLAPRPGGRFALDVGADLEAGRSLLDRVVEGTLVKTVFDDCVQPLLDLLQKRFVDEKGGKPLAGEGSRNRAALLNLLATTDQTGDADRDLSKDEDRRLEALYQALKESVNPSTFCGLFDEFSGTLPTLYSDLLARLEMKTVYGTTPQRGPRIDADNGLAYAFGAAQNGQLHLFRLDEGDGELVCAIVKGQGP